MPQRFIHFLEAIGEILKNTDPFGVLLVTLALLAFVASLQPEREGDLLEPIARADVADPVLGGLPVSTTDGTKDSKYLFVQEVAYPSTTIIKVRKTVYNRFQVPHITSGGHDVLYEFFRENGTHEHDELWFAETHLNAGIYCKKQIRIWDKTGAKMLVDLYFREDGTLGAVHWANGPS